MQPSGGNNLWQSQDEPMLEQPASFSAQQSIAPDDSLVSWQASEYVHHEKEVRWFVYLFGVAAALLAFAIFVIGSYTFAGLIIVMTIVMVIFAVRPPRIMSYSLGPEGLRVNDKHFSYHDFRVFGIIEEGPLYSALLIPNKRFLPAVTLYFPGEEGEAIVDMLGSRIPMEHVELDFLDRLMRKLRF